MIRTGRHLLIVAVVLIAAGCGAGSSRSPFNGSANPARIAPPVEVTNNNWLDAVVYATRLGIRVRIGEVSGMSQRSLRIPAGFAGADGSVGLQVTLIGSTEHFLTGNLYVAADQMIVLDIQNQIATSSWGVFAR
ncbi:MAG: hypothetical protein BMS9Abin29_1639 [Gemmatimonadota bacterium]|nr:MAG: hypothetical protein BMS9Abin29_1639 [Gemmatimonadota bacterium]